MVVAKAIILFIYDKESGLNDSVRRREERILYTIDGIFDYGCRSAKYL